MMIEAERAPIGRAGTECEKPVALIARPLLACCDQRCTNSTSFGHVAGREFVDVSLVFARKVSLVRERGKAKSFAVVVFCDEDHRLLSMLVDTRRNPILKRGEPQVWIAPGWHPNKQARGQAEHERTVISYIGTYMNHTASPCKYRAYKSPARSAPS
jgi:hypothetical protein